MRPELRAEFVEAVQAVRLESQDIPLSSIDPPPKSNDSTKRASSAGAIAVVQRVCEALEADSDLGSKVDLELSQLTSARRRRRLEKRISAALLLEMMDYSNSPHMPARMFVSEGSQGRYTVALTHLSIYEAHVLLGEAHIALGHSTVRCVVQPTGAQLREGPHGRETTIHCAECFAAYRQIVPIVEHGEIRRWSIQTEKRI